VLAPSGLAVVTYHGVLPHAKGSTRRLWGRDAARDIERGTPPEPGPCQLEVKERIHRIPARGRASRPVLTLMPTFQIQ
jgi:hypothetical protein